MGTSKAKAPKSARLPTEDCLGLPVPRLVIESKHPHKTCWARLVYAERDHALLSAVTAAMALHGWHPDRELGGPVPPIDGVADLDFISPGTAIFNGWTDPDTRIKLAGLRVAARSVGLRVTRKRLELEDLL
jgi:hypothetical protein